MKFIYSLLLLLLSFSFYAQSVWTPLAEYPSVGVERTFNFVLDGLVYVGGGRESTSLNTAAVHAYDPATDTWIQKSDFPGTARRNAFAFATGGFAYMGTGYDGSSHLKDFWRYNPTDDTWTELGNFPGGSRSHCIAISEGDKAYVALGGSTSDDVFYSDLWEFDGETETWTQLVSMPGEERWRSYGWLIDGKLYIGGGNRHPSNALEDLYTYDLQTGIWDAVTPCPTQRTAGGFFFKLNNRGYYAEGAINTSGAANFYGNKVFVYDAEADTWTEETDFIGTGRVLGFSAVTDSLAIIGTGRNYETGVYNNDVYSFTPALVSSLQEPELLDLTVFPNPVGGGEIQVKGDFITESQAVISVYDLHGVLVKTMEDIPADNTFTINTSGLAKGIYCLEVVKGDKVGIKKIIVQ